MSEIYLRPHSNGDGHHPPGGSGQDHVDGNDAWHSIEGVEDAIFRMPDIKANCSTNTKIVNLMDVQ